ncbi:hypothetical protein ACJJIG_01420 [Microbulbifer sp. SSSA007]|uniref:hypothetical protein n=2 Tax=unclassified Microbulbifer TaxID=2619833 RepID=UPI004039600D
MGRALVDGTRENGWLGTMVCRAHAVAQKDEQKDRFIFDEEDSKEIIEFFFKSKTEGIDHLGPKGRVLAADMYQDAWDINFDILGVKDAMGNPLSKAPLDRTAKSTFSFSETVFRIKLAINPASSPTLCGGILTMRNAYLLLVVVLFVGCSYFVSWDDKSKVLIGEPITLYSDLNGPPDEIKTLSDGQKEYKYHLKKLDPSCIHYWTVNQEGIITGYRYTGYCRPVG